MARRTAPAAEQRALEARCAERPELWDACDSAVCDDPTGRYTPPGHSCGCLTLARARARDALRQVTLNYDRVPYSGVPIPPSMYAE